MSGPERISTAASGRSGQVSVPPRRKLTLKLDKRDAATILHVEGDIDLATVPPLRDAAFAELEGGPAVLVLDFSGVGFLASAGLSALTALLDAAEPRTKLRIVAGPIAYRAIEFSGLATELSVFSTLDDALAST